jgi:hypothetical protein
LHSSLKKPIGLFLNTTQANCSIYESGKMIHKSLMLSSKYDLDYLEVDENSRPIPTKYDFYAFNYHYIAMRWLDTRSIRRLPGIKTTFVLEVLPNDPFVLCPKDFDAYCALDPTMNVADQKVYPFPRPLDIPTRITPYRTSAIPVIGTFGFATLGKGFELVVDAVNREFDKAIIKINMPSGTYTDAHFWKLHRRNYADHLSELCERVARKGIQVIVTRDYMTKEDLVEWCSQNTLNCFLYNRNQPGLAATTDQAISSGRPLAVSMNETFRHIHAYLKPYPFQSLKESITLSQSHVLRMQKDWAPQNFAIKFEGVLADFGLFSDPERKRVQLTSAKGRMAESQLFSLKMREDPTKVKSMQLKVRSILKIRTRIRGMLRTSGLIAEFERSPRVQLLGQTDISEQRNKILIVSYQAKQCGIHQYGVNITEALQRSSRYSFAYVQCSNEEHLRQAILQTNPSAIIYNYYPWTMPWLSARVTRRYRIPQLGFMHEVTQQEADEATQELFDYHLCPDPTLIENNPFVFRTRRLIPSYINSHNIPDILTVGSFGFGLRDKGFERLIDTVQREFDRARIVLNLPFNDIVDKQGKSHALATAERCRNVLAKPGIELVIKHDFLTKQQLLDFLASNTINAFFYDSHKHRGISSTIEYALAVQRPVAITRCGMFRHVSFTTPSICIEDSSLKQIIDNDIVPLVPFYNEWSEPAFVLDYERILSEVFSREQSETFATRSLLA